MDFIIILALICFWETMLWLLQSLHSQNKMQRTEPRSLMDGWMDRLDE